ncbi:Tm-1-like ATP-binding domain-containing protein [Salibacterium salarium]|uniref:Tm-1-like ATP-binding domain-containing protein n=1 Tax=Salibacterium salarium TaxID=284579 RepID=UPI001FE52595|nr:Tm-1-like ATP-binding domain-containing protein [Salibacterium salarium]
MRKVLLLGTLDTKGEEFQFIKEIIEDSGVKTLVMNCGVKGAPLFQPDIANVEVAERGGESLEKLIKADDRGSAIDVMMKGAALLTFDLFESGAISGVISLGGSAGTTIGTHAMQSLPVGVPKVMVSTIASGDTRPYVGVTDITMMYSVVDISGINPLSSQILANAAFAISGMANGNVPALQYDKPLIGATMFGLTTPCVTKAREYLEKHGYNVLVFHATGTGGKAMETLIESGYIKAVLDVTTTEWCDELVGGIYSAGPYRMEAASKASIPQVVSTGALDMVNFGGMDTVPESFKNRNLYKHNATTTLMRTSKEENKELGKIIAEKMNRTNSSAALFLPLNGVSGIDTQGKPFFGPGEDQLLFQSLRDHVTSDTVEIIEKNNHINDEEFALAMAQKLIELIETN